MRFVRKFVCQNNESVNKYNFAQLFRLAWDESLKPATLVNSFRACGICPYYRDAIPAGKVLSSTTYAHKIAWFTYRSVDRNCGYASPKVQMVSTVLQELQGMDYVEDRSCRKED